MPDFVAWPKIMRLNREIVITEKIDGTNTAIGITEMGEVYAQGRRRILTTQDDHFGFARWVELHADALRTHLGAGIHFGEWWGVGINRGYDLSERRFSLFNVTRWTSSEGALALANLRLNDAQVHVVPVLYTGAWHGTFGFIDGPMSELAEAVGEGPVWLNAPQGWTELDSLIMRRELDIDNYFALFGQPFPTPVADPREELRHLAAPVNPRPRFAPEFILEWLKRIGSQAAPGFMQPEGIVIYHKAADMLLKATVEKDEKHKFEA